MTLALLFATAGACALAFLVVFAACRAAAVGDAQLARTQVPSAGAAPLGGALPPPAVRVARFPALAPPALPGGLARFPAIAAEVLAVDVAAVLLDEPDDRGRVVAVAGAPEL